ncbi:response regulator [Paenibacillaceae bacterium]|nr:response regulator [Paenibacillaceae bacterium]
MYNLLLVDDEADTREALSNYFPWHDVGFQIVGQAGNGKEALELLARAEQPIDVILTDIKMPVMSGIELAEAVYEQKRPVQVIFLSSYREFEYAQQALTYRVKNYILKPAKYQVLLDVFGKIREEMQAAQEISAPARNNEDAHLQDEGGIISKIKAYIRDGYKEATLEDAAKQVHLNANYASYLFKKKTGQNFSEYLIQVKMEAAAKLMLNNHFKTYEISEMVGYSNAKNFTRTFKSFHGKTPSEYRNGSCQQ